MNELTKTESGALISLLHGGAQLELGRPFERDIFLIGTSIAGTSYVDDFSELEARLNIGDRVNLLREPENEFDEYAIVVRNAEGAKLGYVPRRFNLIPSRLMDAGKLLFGIVHLKENQADFINVVIKIYMRD